MKKRFSQERIVGILRDVRVGQKTIEAIARENGVSENTIYLWKRKYASMEESEVRRLRELERENHRLKRLLADRDVEIDVMREIVEKKFPR
jgi:putative transposase